MLPRAQQPRGLRVCGRLLTWDICLPLCTQVQGSSSLPPLSPEAASQAVKILASVVQTSQDHLSSRTMAVAMAVVDNVAASRGKDDSNEPVTAVSYLAALHAVQLNVSRG